MLFDIVDLSPVILPIVDQNAPVGGGASSRGSHRLSDISNCQRKWWFRYVQRVVARGEPEFRLMGTLIHSAVAFHYASMMLPELQPDWFKAKPLYQELLDQARGNAVLADRAFEIGEQYIEYWRLRGCDWVPFSVEQEYSASIGTIDPDGEDEPAFTLDVLDATGKPRQLTFPTLNDERITCRTDLIVQRSSNGTMWAVDHKSKNPEFHADRFGKVNPNGEFALDWQVLVNLMILRANDLPVRGFIIQRIKRDPPFDCHRQVLNVPGLAYEQAPRLARNQVRLEREQYRSLAAGKTPIPNFFNCFGRFGACDYRPICSAEDADEQRGILNANYVRL